MEFPDRSSPPAVPDGITMTRADWRAAEQAHQDRVDELTAGHRYRSARGQAHPVEDFLFSYYPQRPGRLRRWHSGARVTLLDAPERSGLPWHETFPVHGTIAVRVDIAAFERARGPRLAAVRQLLARTAAAPARFGCFGWHEWAMVFRSSERRHPELLLRLGAAGTDEVVRSAQIRCTHFDAVRFFTPAARPRNTVNPAAALADRHEQRGCLHATMDLYRWAYEFAPLVGSELIVACFVLAGEVRSPDMRASPYDLSSLGYPPVAVETAAGRAEYVAAQRAFSARGDELRQGLLRALGFRSAA